MIQTELDSGIDIVDGSHAVLIAVDSLQHEGEQAAVDDEARGVSLALDRLLAHLLGNLADSGHGGVGGVAGADHLNQLHGVHGEEEVHADAALRVLAVLGDLADGHGRGVGAQDGIGLADLTQLHEGIVLQGQDLGSGLNDKVSGGNALQLDGGGDAGHDGVGSLLSRLALGNPACPDRP